MSNLSENWLAEELEALDTDPCFYCQHYRKNYFLFGGRNYYSAGGWSDYVERYTTLDEAVKEGERLITECCPKQVDWYEVVDVLKGTIEKKGHRT